MATRTIWQDLYGIQHDVGTSLATHVSGDPTYTGAKVGILGDQGAAGAGKFSLPLTDHPNFKAPSATLDTEEARGLSERHIREYKTVQTGEPIEFTLPLGGQAYNITGLLLTLFQTGQTGSGCEEAAHATDADMNLTTVSPYTVADCVTFSYFSRSLQPAGGSDGVDLMVKGGICSSLTLSGETGGVLGVEAIIKGASWEQTDLSALTTILETSFDEERVLKYQDSVIAFEDYFTVTEDFTDLTFANAGKTITSAALADFTTNFSVGDRIRISVSAKNDLILTIDTVVALIITVLESTLVDDGSGDASCTISKLTWVDVKSPAISLTVADGVIFNYYNDDVAVSAHLGRLTAEGTITIPFSQATVGGNYMIQRFLAGDPIRVAWFWGQSGDTADIEADFDLGYADGSVSPDRYKNDASATDPRNFLSAVMNMRCTDYEMVGDNELMIECTFSAAKDKYWDAIQFYMAYDEAKLDWEA